MIYCTSSSTSWWDSRGPFGHTALCRSASQLCPARSPYRLTALPNCGPRQLDRTSNAGRMTLQLKPSSSKTLYANRFAVIYALCSIPFLGSCYHECWPSTAWHSYHDHRLSRSKAKVGTVWRLGLVHVVNEEAHVTGLLAEPIHRTLSRLPP